MAALRKHLWWLPHRKQTYICMHILYCQAGEHLHSSYMQKLTRTQSSTIYYGLGGPQKTISSPQEQIFADLFRFYLHIHLPFCMFVSEVMRTCMCQCVHVLCKSCLLRRWIKQQVHLICKALRGKYTKWDTHAHTHTHRLAYSIKIISVTESILRSSNKPFFPWYKSLLFISTESRTYAHTHTHTHTHTHLAQSYTPWWS